MATIRACSGDSVVPPSTCLGLTATTTAVAARASVTTTTSHPRRRRRDLRRSGDVGRAVPVAAVTAAGPHGRARVRTGVARTELSEATLAGGGRDPGPAREPDPAGRSGRMSGGPERAVAHRPPRPVRATREVAAPVANHASSAHPPAGGADADPRRPAAPEDPDAPHVQPNLSYIPGLDGARAFAVLGVMAFHGGVSFMSAGFLGVDAFFVLSGFLITSLLIAEWQRIATIRLGTFWARRARRLLPALFLVLLAVAAYAAFAVPRGTYPGLRLDALSTLFYVANWHFILTSANYWNMTGPVSPLTHTWSLAIEEQFYLVWPIVVLVVLRLTRTLRPLLAVAAGGAVASAVWMAVLAQRRRAGGWVASGPVVGGDPAWAAGTSSGRAALIALGLAGFGASAYLWTHLDGSSPFLYQGG